MIGWWENVPSRVVEEPSHRPGKYKLKLNMEAKNAQGSIRLKLAVTFMNALVITNHFESLISILMLAYNGGFYYWITIFLFRF